MPELQPFFIGDDLALDFLNSVAAPWGREIEWLASGSDLVAWLEQAHALPTDLSAHFRQQAEFDELNAVAFQARELREWFREFVVSHAGKPLPRNALRELAPLNHLLEQDQAYRQIAMTPNRGKHGGNRHQALRWEAKRRWHNVQTLLLPIAEAIGDLVCRKDFSLVRRCEGPTCTLWFLDVSKGHARRWCSMAVCGNRAKAAAYRSRARRHNADTGK
jgi:predicted RNA-binding Zn ribbon-like protein